MKSAKTPLLLALTAICLCTTSCRRSSNDVWEDSKTAGRYMGRGVKSLAGKHGDSRQISSRDQFGLAMDDHATDRDYIAMGDDPGASLGIGSKESFGQSRLNPGDPGSGIPGIDAFKDPSSDPALAGIFRHIHFDYDSSLLQGEENLQIAKQVANYMKSHSNTYLFVEGHCDERGPQAYNFALGTNRSNTLRNYLINDGVNADNVFTISYGKERPLVQGKGESSWQQNRRAQFKVYTR